MIFEKQTEKYFIDLLSAKSYYYDKAERRNDWEYILATLAAVSTILTLFLPPELENFIGLFGIAIFFLTMTLITSKKQEYTKLGALIQEKFDTQLFELPENEHLEEVTAELGDAVKYFSDKERKKHEDEGWYPEPPTDNRELAILLAQRANLAWDYKLRKYHATVLNSVLIVVIILLLGISILFNYTVLDFLAQWVAPFLPLLWLFHQNAQANNKLYKEQKSKEKEINRLACRVHQGEEQLTNAYLRSLQNTIYKNRANNPVLKRKWYHNKRDKYNADMIEVTNNLLKNC